jgi:hypothetical protein
MSGAIALILLLYGVAAMPINIAGFLLMGLAIALFVIEAFHTYIWYTTYRRNSFIFPRGTHAVSGYAGRNADFTVLACACNPADSTVLCLD